MATAPSFSSRLRFCGLLAHRPRWSLTLRGWLLLLAVSISAVIVSILGVHRFLAVNKPIPADVLVVEGWIPDRAFKEVVQEINLGRYKTIYTTGGAVSWQGAEKFGGTYAGFSAMRLHHAGIPTNMIIAVPTDTPDWDRTYRSAAALQAHLHKSAQTPASLNVITSGPHARRTRLLYRRAFGGDIGVGIVTIPRDDYDPEHWWRSSTGLREVISETAAYLYCRATPSAFKDE